MKTLVAMMLLLCTLTFVSHSNAEDGVVELWDCVLNDGKTIDDAARVNAKWLKLQNEMNPDAGIRSWGLTSIVGKPSSYGYLDAYPSLDAWAKGQAGLQTAAGRALEAEFNDTATC